MGILGSASEALLRAQLSRIARTALERSLGDDRRAELIAFVQKRTAHIPLLLHECKERKTAITQRIIALENRHLST